MYLVYVCTLNLEFLIYVCFTCHIKPLLRCVCMCVCMWISCGTVMQNYMFYLFMKKKHDFVLENYSNSNAIWICSPCFKHFKSLHLWQKFPLTNHPNLNPPCLLLYVLHNVYIYSMPVCFYKKYIYYGLYIILMVLLNF